MSDQPTPPSMKRKRQGSDDSQRSHTPLRRAFNELGPRDQTIKNNRRNRMELNWGVKLQEAFPVSIRPRVELKKGAKIRVGDQHQQEEAWWNWSVELLRALEELSGMTAGKLTLARILLEAEVKKRQSESKNPQRKVAELLLGDAQRAVEKLRQTQAEQAANKKTAEHAGDEEATENADDDEETVEHADNEETTEDADAMEQPDDPVQMENHNQTFTSHSDSLFMSDGEDHAGNDSTNQSLSAHRKKVAANHHVEEPIPSMSPPPRVSGIQARNADIQGQRRIPTGMKNFSVSSQSFNPTSSAMSNQGNHQILARTSTRNFGYDQAQQASNVQHLGMDMEAQAAQIRDRAVHLRAQAAQLEAEASQLEAEAAQLEKDAAALRACLPHR